MIIQCTTLASDHKLEETNKRKEKKQPNSRTFLQTGKFHIRSIKEDITLSSNKYMFNHELDYHRCSHCFVVNEYFFPHLVRFIEMGKTRAGR